MSRNANDRILIAGIGNIFFGDDAFGVEVVRRIGQTMPAAVRVADFGIRSYDLAFALMDGYETAILVDAMPRGGVAGTLYTLEPDGKELSGCPDSLDGHRLDPATLLGLVQQMGGTSTKVLVVGCEPESLGDEDQGAMGLSAVVDAAADEAVSLLRGLATRLLGEMQEAVVTPTLDFEVAQKAQDGGRK